MHAATSLAVMVLSLLSADQHEETPSPRTADAGDGGFVQPVAVEPSAKTSRPSFALPSRQERGATRRSLIPRELPEDLEEQPAEGLSLDAVLERLLAANRDLAIKYQEVPKARADILSAGLIENPSVFLDSEGIPYGNYSPQRPGETSYGPTIVQPFDVSGKRQRRLRVARRAEQVLEALYQDAVRQEIDALYSAYVDVLEATLHRNAVRRAIVNRGEEVELPDAVMRRANAEIALREAETSLLHARRELAHLLAIPPEQADHLTVRGSLHDGAPLPPDVDKLIALALQTRPDLAAYQLSVERAKAHVQLSKAERLDDVLIFYTPYQATTFPSQGQQTASGWESGGLSALPIFDRKQGDLARGKADVRQLQIQWQGLRNAVIYEVRRAAADYALTRQLVQKYQSEILKNVRAFHEEKHRLFLAGKENKDSFLAAEQKYQDALRQYFTVLVQHRRSMLRLNTVVGQRILP